MSFRKARTNPLFFEGRHLAQLPQFGVRDADFVPLLRGDNTVFSFCSA
jgi:hypothetical protein